MKTIEKETVENTTAKQIITQVINAWHAQNKAVAALLAKFPDHTYLNEVAPGRNRAIYLVGHLAAFNDGLLPMFGLGERMFPQLETAFVTNADKAAREIPSIAELKRYWEVINETLIAHFNKMTVNEWMDRHTKVSEEDFEKDPLRNKLNVLLGRTNHQSYHIGQLNFLTEKK